MIPSNLRLYIDPPSYHFLQDRLFSEEKTRFMGDQLMAPHIYLRDYLEQQGIETHTADLLPEQPGGGLNLYVSLGMFRDYKKLARRKDIVLSAFLAVECPIVEPSIYRKLAQVQGYFRRVLSWSDTDSLLRFTGRPLRCQHFHWPQSFDQVHEPIWQRQDRKFLVMMNSNKLPRVYWKELYTERMRAVAFFSQHGEIDLYGPGWDQPSVRVGRTRVPYTLTRLHRYALAQWQKARPDPLLQAARSVYRGKAASKSATLGGYTFALCFENMRINGWITEKIFDCFYSGTVPVYLGAPDIHDYVPESCFIDMRNFPGYEALRSYLKSMTCSQVDAYRENARKFLASAQFEPFTKRAFAERFRQMICEDAGVILGAPA